jgi:hypothetical protein
MRRGQAATEFLMTYGWAVLMTLVAMGALAYFGIFSPRTFMPDNCDVGVPFGCFEYLAYQDGIALSLRYGGLDMLDRVNISVEGCTSMQKSASLQSGDVVRAYMTCPQSGDRVKANFNVIYHAPDHALDQQTDGRIILLIQKNNGIASPKIEFCHDSACS